MKYYIIAGESSGDLYGGLLIQELKKLDQKAIFRYWGGPKMELQSPGMVKSIKETSFMGFVEVAKNVFTIREMFSFAKTDILDWQPDVLILIDYPGFNLRIAQWAKQKNIKLAYYVSPQLWAWKENRHKILRSSTDLFFVILPFEQDFYRNLDTPCIYYGHPLIDLIQDRETKENITVKKVGLFPGSRKQEIKRHLPLMVEFASRHQQYHFIVAGLSHIPKDFYLDHIPKYVEHMDVEFDNSYEVMSGIDAAIVSSGTATLELALFNIPQIVIYKTNPISFAIGKKLVNTEYISLVNLIAQKQVVPELLQNELNIKSLSVAFKQIVQDDKYRNILESYKKIRSELGDGNSSSKVAVHLYKFLLENQ
ncbi:MAG: lipid-A-disaccharide synthase [Bacteroidia bacterium]|nr:lipid-A-disaccharide synthase [Bacteroidia bacterium]